MLQDRVEQKGFIVGDSPFGLVEKDAKFARWDARKILRRDEENTTRLVRWAKLFENTTNEVLLDRMGKLYSGIAEMETSGLTRTQILGSLITEDPDISDYGLLLTKAPWGERLRQDLEWENYQQDENGVLWNDFVMSRIHRALGGKLDRHSRYDGRFSYQIDTAQDVLRFNPESNANANDGPEISITGNRIEKQTAMGWDTDQRFSLNVKNITRVKVCETDEKIVFIKVFPGEELFLKYSHKAVGSNHQIELETVTTRSHHTIHN